MSSKRGSKYTFSQANDCKAVNINISPDLHERIMTLCNITEMTQTSICRYLLKRGISEL